MNLDNIKIAIKNYKKSQSEENMDEIFSLIRFYNNQLPLDIIYEISTVVDKKNKSCGVDLFAIINLLFEFPGLYFTLSEKQKPKLIKRMVDYYSIPELLKITCNLESPLGGIFEGIIVDLDSSYLEKYQVEFLKNEFPVFNVYGDKYREFLIDNMHNPEYKKKSSLYEDLICRYNCFNINVKGLYKTLRYMESKGQDVIKEILEQKDKQILHAFYWIETRKNSGNDLKYVSLYYEYLIYKMETAGMCLKDVLNFTSSRVKNKETEFTYKYFSYALEKEMETADIIMDYLINSGEEPKVIEQLQVLKNKKEKKDLIYKIEVINNDTKEKVLRI